MKKLVITLLCLVVVISFVYSRGDKETPEEESVITEVQAGKYKESPMLTELVKKGELPPVDERLPVEPCVIGP